MTARAFPLLLLAVALSGCYPLRLKHGKRIAEAGAARERWVHTFFGGVWQPEGPVKLDELCPQGVAAIEQDQSVPNWAAQQLSSIPASAPAIVYSPAAPPAAYMVFGRHIQIWNPWTVRVWCSKGATTSLKIAVVQLQARGGLNPETVQLFTEALVAELRRQPGTTVLSDQDISAALGLERQKQLLGCGDASCLTEIGGALGVDRLIHGSVGRVGESLVVTLTSIDPVKSKAMSSVSERLKGANDEVFLDALPGLASQLLQEALAK
jgi:hypothetical protein